MGCRGNTRRCAKVVTRGVDVRCCRRPLQVRETVDNIAEAITLDLDRRSRCAIYIHKALVRKNTFVETIFLDNDGAGNICQGHGNCCLRTRTITIASFEFTAIDRYA